MSQSAVIAERLSAIRQQLTLENIDAFITMSQHQKKYLQVFLPFFSFSSLLLLSPLY